MIQYDTDMELALDLAKQGSALNFVADVPSGRVFLGLNQVLKGTCFLVAEPVIGTLDSLPVDGRAAFIEDMLAVGRAIMKITGADKINYLFLGNKDPVLHVHLVPRFGDEDPEYKTHGPWRYQEYVKFDIERDQSLITDLKSSLSGC